jgi:hypothetical protein
VYKGALKNLEEFETKTSHWYSMTYGRWLDGEHYFFQLDNPSNSVYRQTATVNLASYNAELVGDEEACTQDFSNSPASGVEGKL